MKIVFMGTPEFAESSLAALLSSRHQVIGVFTQPDKPKGRGYKLVPPPVKELAMAHSIPVYQPQKMRDGEALSILQELQPDLIAVVAYGKILPKEILELPKYGCVNVHGSLLPKYRGAGPIQWSVINGEEKTGLTAASAGLYTENGLPASANAVAAAGERGADISAHRSQQLTAEMAENAKYLVCMTGSHYDRLCELFPDCADKIFTLLPEDISDPFGGDLATYRGSAAEIDKGVQAIIKNLSR